MKRLLLTGICASICLTLALSVPSFAKDPEPVDPEKEGFSGEPGIGPFVSIPEDESVNNACPGQAINCGDVVSGALTAGDNDYYSFFVNGGDLINVFTQQSGATSTDTFIHLMSAGCGADLETDDDDGCGAFSDIYGRMAPVSGVYTVRVRHFSATGTGAYILVVVCTPASARPPANDTCAGAFPIGCGPFTLTGTNEGGANNIDLTTGTTSCTGFSAAGRDVMYSMNITQPGTILTVLEYRTAIDPSMYLVSDPCVSPANAICLAGKDAAVCAHEVNLTYTFTAVGTYYLILDAFGTIGSTTPPSGYLAIGSLDCPAVPVESTTWGNVKSRFSN